MDIIPYKLADDDFYASPDRGSDPLARELVGDYRGLLIDAPARVDVALRSTLPAGIYHLGAIRELSALPFDRFGVITAMHLDANQLYAAPGSALKRDDDLMESPPRDPADLPEGDMSSTYPVDFRELLPIPWQPGRYLLTALLRDTVSNRVEVELFGPAAAPESPVQETDVFPPPERNVTSYQRHPKAPGIPAEFGIALAPQRIVDLRHDWQWPLYGAFHLPAQSDGVVPIHLLITGSDDNSLDLIHIRVPPTGYFTVDLNQLTSMRAPQTYFVSAFSGRFLASPVPTALIEG